MRLSLLHRLRVLHEGPGFYPAFLGLAGLALAALVAWGNAIPLDAALATAPWRNLTSVEAGRAIFPTLAAACITVAGVVFSITIVGLSQVSTQYGPRLLGSFMRASGTQVVLGVFVGTFVYLLAAHGRIALPYPDGGEPRLAVLLGLLLAIASFGGLVFFIHHLTNFLQVPRLLDRVTREMMATLDRTFDRPREEGGSDGAPATNDAEEEGAGGRAIPSPRSGYVQVVDERAILAVAERDGARVHCLVRAGDLVYEGDVVLRVVVGGELSEEALDALGRSLTIGPRRTRTQDPEYAVDQVRDMAVRALSPGVNDPGTAMFCVDRLGLGLLAIAGRRAPPHTLRSEAGRVLLVARRHDHAGMVKAALAGVRQSAGGQLAVLLHLVEVIASLAGHDMPRSMRHALAEEGAAALDLATDAVASRGDEQDVERRRKAMEAAFGGDLPPRRGEGSGPRAD